MDFLKQIIFIYILCMGVIQMQAMRRRRPPKVRPGGIEQRNNFGSSLASESFLENENCIYNLCSNVSRYPGNLIKGMINKKKEFHRFFGSVIQPYHVPTLAAKSPINGEDKNMCPTQQYTYFPEIALNKNRKKVFIVNVEKFKQAVSFETCVPRANCFLANHKPAGYTTACKQQYNLIRLVSMTEHGNLTLDTFPIPSSCVCTYRQVIGYT